MKKCEWKAIKNPRKPNGDLGDIKCDWCGCQTGAYVKISNDGFAIHPHNICKGCLLKGIDKINHVILDGLTCFSDENKT